jgi:hypothetical protein
MKRTFHSIYRMYAWNFKDLVALISHDDLNDAIGKYLHEIDANERLKYKLSVFSNMAYIDRKRHEEIDRILSANLEKAVVSGEVDIQYDFSSEEARKYAEDFIEAYRYNYKNINYAIGDFHDASDEIINISLRKKQNVFQYLTRRYGDTYGELNIPLSHIHRLKGNAPKFVLYTNEVEYHFDEGGVTRKNP